MPPAGGRHIVLHAGFHKTGTTTVQTFLRRNAAILDGALLTLQNADLRDFIQSCRSFSMWRDPISKDQIADRLKARLTPMSVADSCPLLISVEEMSGLLPGLPQRRGRPEIETYAAAPDLIGIIAATCRAHFGPGSPVSAIYGIRSAETWLRSVYWQHVKVQRMVLDEDEFMTRYRYAADLVGVTTEVAQANPDVSVSHFSLETVAAEAFGPAGLILDLCRLEPELTKHCTMPPPINVAPPPDVLQAMLDLNRSSLDSDSLKARKKEMEAQVRHARGL